MRQFDYTKFKATLRTLIVESGYSNKDISEYLGCSPQAVYKWINGAAMPNFDNLVALASLFNVPISTMMPTMEMKYYGTSRRGQEIEAKRLREEVEH